MRSDNKTGTDWSNPDEVRAYNRKRNREQYKDPEYREKVIEVHQKRCYNNKIKAIEYTGGLRCHNPECVHIKHGEHIDLCAVDFHHVLTQNKTKRFGHLFRHASWKRCKEEIDKCKAIPLCSICHMIEEHGKDEERFGDILDE